MGREGLATNSKRGGGGLWGRRVEGEPDVRACMYLRTEGEYPAASPQEEGEQNFLLCYNERVGLYHEKPPLDPPLRKKIVLLLLQLRLPTHGLAASQRTNADGQTKKIG